MQERMVRAEQRRRTSSGGQQRLGAPKPLARPALQATAARTGGAHMATRASAPTPPLGEIGNGPGAAAAAASSSAPRGPRAQPAARSTLSAQMHALQTTLTAMHAQVRRELPEPRADPLAACFGECVAEFAVHEDGGMRATALASIRQHLAASASSADLRAALPVLLAALADAEAAPFAAALELLPVVAKAQLPARVASAEASSELKPALDAAVTRAERASAAAGSDRAERRARAKAVDALAAVAALDAPSALALVAEAVGGPDASCAASALVLRLDVLARAAERARAARLRQLPAGARTALLELISAASHCSQDEGTRARAADVAHALDRRAEGLQREPVGSSEAFASALVPGASPASDDDQPALMEAAPAVAPQP